MPVRVDPSNWKLVAEIIKLAIQQGCQLRTPDITVVTPWGKKSFRYLYNPETEGTFDLSCEEDDETLGPASLDAAERRLGIKLKN